MKYNDPEFINEMFDVLEKHFPETLKDWETQAFTAIAPIVGTLLLGVTKKERAMELFVKIALATAKEVEEMNHNVH